MKEFPCQRHQLVVARMIYSLHCGNAPRQIWVVLGQVILQLQLGMGRSSDQEQTGVGENHSYTFEKISVDAPVTTASDVRPMFQVVASGVRLHSKLIHLGCCDEEHLGDTVIDPDNGVGKIRHVAGLH